MWGRTDTGNPGAFAKEQSTWDGLVRLLYHRRSQSLNWLTLHCAKVSLEQYEAAAAAMEVENAAIIIPHFLRPLNAYKQRLEQIALDNGLEAWLAPAKAPLSLRPPPLPSPTPPALPILAGGRVFLLVGPCSRGRGGGGWRGRRKRMERGIRGS